MTTTNSGLNKILEKIKVSLFISPTAFCKNNFTYKTGFFGAVLADANKYPTRIWRGKSKKNAHDVVALFKIHWLQAKEGIYESTYSFDFVGQTERNQFPWLEMVLVDSIIQILAP